MARVFIWVFYHVHDWFDSFKVPMYFKPAIGGILTGCIGFVIPDALAEGYGMVQNALDGKVVLTTLGIVAVAKILTTSFTIASGGSGGVFGPSIVIGGCLGGVVGLWAQKVFPFPLQTGAFVLAGMAGFFSAASRVPISSIIMVSEITGSYHLLVPTMWVSILSFLLNRDMTLFRKQLPTRFDAPSKLGEMMSKILARMHVRDIYRTKPGQPLIILKENQHIKEVMETFVSSKQTQYPLTGSNGEFIGVIDQEEIRKLLHEPELDHLIIASDLLLPLPTVALEDNLKTAIRRMIGSGQEELIILEENRPIGLLTRHDIVDHYDRRMKVGEITTAISKKDVIQARQEMHFDGVFYDLSCKNKSEVFRFLVPKLSLPQDEQEILIADLLERDSREETGIGDGIAIPHSRCKRISHPCSNILIGVLQSPIPFNSLDGKPVDIVCIVLCSDAMAHLEP